MNDPFPPTGAGGAEVYAAHVAKEMGRRGHAVKVLTSHRKSAPGDVYDAIPIIAWKLPSIPGFNPFAAGKDAGEDFDVVHLNNFRRLTPSILGKLRERGSKFVWTVHDYYPVCPRLNMVRRDGVICREPANYYCPTCFLQTSERGVPALGLWNQFAARHWIFPHVDRYVAPSAAMARALAAYGLPRDKISILYNGVPETPAPTLPTESRILFVGNPNASHKGFQDLLRALPKTTPDVCLTVVGGTISPSLRREAIELGVMGRIFERGRVLTVYPEYTAASVVVVPSRWEENCSMVILEALMAGRPVVASRVGGNPELVTDLNGALFEGGNVQDLAAALNRLLRDAGTLARMSRAAHRDAIGRFGLDRNVSELERIYQDVLA